MSTHRLLLLSLLSPVALLAACASTPDQVASRDCKVVVADFPGRPAKNVSSAEQALAQMRVSRLAAERGGYASGPNLAADAARDCY